MAISLFALGLLILAIGAALLAVDTWNCAPMHWAGIPLALLVILYLPQFFAPDVVRVAHGILLGAACVFWAFAHVHIRVVRTRR